MACAASGWVACGQGFANQRLLRGLGRLKRKSLILDRGLKLQHWKWNTTYGRLSKWGSEGGLTSNIGPKTESQSVDSAAAPAILSKQVESTLNAKACPLPKPQNFLQKLSTVVSLTPQHKSIVLLNVLAFIDGATGVVVKGTELDTGSVDAPTAGTSLMFLVRFMVGLLAFAPAFSNRRSREAAAAAAPPQSPVNQAGLAEPDALVPVVNDTLLPRDTALPAPLERLGTEPAPVGWTVTGAGSEALTPANMKLSVAAGSLGAELEERESDAEAGLSAESAWKTLYLPGMLSGLFLFVGDAAQAMGLETSSADHAAVLLTGSVILVPFLEAFSGRKIGAPVWLSALMATAGMILLEQGSAITDVLSNTSGQTLAFPAMPIGDIWCLLSSIGFALYIVLSEEQCSRTDPMKLAAVQLASTVALSALWEAWDLYQTGGSTGSAVVLFRHLAAMPWAAVLFVGVVGTGLATWMELQALQTVNSTTATLVYTTGPLWSALLAYFMLGETMDAVSCGGAALILLASIGTQLFAPPKTVRTGRALIPPLEVMEDQSIGRGSEVDKVPVGSEGESKSVIKLVDNFVGTVHKVVQLPPSRVPPKLLPVRAVANQPRLFSRKEIVPRLRKLFHHIRR